jgi:hypothetical protein
MGCPGRGAEFRSHELEWLTAIMRGWQLEGEHAINAIRAVRSALLGFVSLERSGGFARSGARDASFEALLELVVAGLASGVHAGRTPFMGPPVVRVGGCCVVAGYGCCPLAE